MKEETKVEQKKEGSLKYKIILPIDRLQEDEDGLSAVRIKGFKYADVKKAVLDLKEVIYNTANDEFRHNETPNYEEVLTYVLKHIDEIFGDFEK